MRNFYTWASGMTLIAILVSACVEPYDPSLSSEDINHLVVDGFLNASEGIATVALTRTLPVKDEAEIPTVTGAMVYIENGSGDQYMLIEQQPGIYRGNVSPANNDQHRLVIRITDREYVSDFVSIIETPPIDSISYSVTADGLEFAVNTHDITGRSRYYRWEYEETYEYRSAFSSIYMFSGDEIVFRPMELAINTCWKTNPSTAILVGSTKHLSESVISQAPITFVPKESIKLSVEYSLLVQQQAITEEAYNYWLNLRKSTENLGGLFDPLPAEVTGNIHSSNNPDETVLGLFSVGTVRELRKTVKRAELPPEIRSVYSDGYCVADTILLEDLPNIPHATLLIGELYNEAGFLIGYSTSMSTCIDCRTKGGTTEKPIFWE